MCVSTIIPLKKKIQQTRFITSVQKTAIVSFQSIPTSTATSTDLTSITVG